MSFSPTKNLLAWVDNEGTLTRWPGPIPATSPDPVKPTKTLTTIPVKRKPSPSLFDDLDEGTVVPLNNVDGDVDMDDLENADWILDDIGDGMEDEPEADRWNGKDGVVREMGRCPLVLSVISCSHFVSECDKSTARFPTWVFTHGEQEAVSRSVITLGRCPIIEVESCSLQHGRRNRGHRPGHTPHNQRRVSRPFH